MAIPRHQLSEVLDDLTDAPIAVIAGARQVGKSTLMAEAIDAHGGAVRTLDDPTVLEAATRDPVAFLEHDGLLAIDEIQRAPELVLPMKMLVDRGRRPGMFLVTGSADLLRVAGVADSLAGRTATTRLRPLSQGEIWGRRETFIDQCFESVTSFDAEPLGRQQYAERICIGGYPTVVTATSDRARRRFLSDYVERVLVRSAAEVAEVERPERLVQLLRLIAAQSGAELNRADLARHLGVAASTVDRLVDVLEVTFLVERVPAWSRNFTERAVRRPKLYVSDSGMLAHLVGVGPGVFDPASVSRAVGPLVETFVVAELLRQSSWSSVLPTFHHLREHDGGEVDLVLEAPDGRVVALEIKTTQAVTAQHTRWIDRLADRLGRDFVHGYVLHTGHHCLPFGPNVTAVPISALWCA